MKFYPNGTVPKQANMYFIYGDGGTGKTSLAKQFEGNKMLFSFDLSTNVLIGEKDISVVQLESGDAPNIQSLIDKWVLGALMKSEYEVIILDNMTALQNLVLENIDGASRDGRQNYQKLQLWFRQLGTKLRESNKTIYATAELTNDYHNELAWERTGRSLRQEDNIKNICQFYWIYDGLFSNNR